MATHSSVLAWRIPGMREPGGLLSMGSHRVRHDRSDLAAAAAAADLYISLEIYIKDQTDGCQGLGEEVKWGDAGQMVQTSSYKKL